MSPFLEDVDRRKFSPLPHRLGVVVDDDLGHHLGACLHALVDDDFIEGERTGGTSAI